MIGGFFFFAGNEQLFRPDDQQKIAVFFDFVINQNFGFSKNGFLVFDSYRDKAGFADEVSDKGILIISKLLVIH